MNNLDYGVIGNCRSAALVSREGSIDWCCLPDFDSDSIFAKLLDKNKGGEFLVTGAHTQKVSQQYLRKTNILKTVFECEDGTFELIDFMPRYIDADNIYHTPPELIRIVRPLKGTPKVKVFYNPKLDYAEYPTVSKIHKDYIKSTAESVEHAAYQSIYLYSSFSLEDVFHSNEIVLDQSNYLLLNYNQKIGPLNADKIDLEFQKTRVYWMSWSSKTTQFARYQDEIDRSALALKLLSYQKSGAILAAVTTSLPESIGEVRNWDYRFCWLRDASMTITILHKLRHYTVATQFIDFVLNILPYKDDHIQIMYGIHGDKNLEEKILDWLDGYENSKPVRVGNAAYFQKQNDIYGVLIDMMYQHLLYSQSTMHNREGVWTVVRSLAKTVKENWDKTDNSIWEFRTESKHFTFSKVLCWVAMDRASKIAQLFDMHEYADQWYRLSEVIRDDIMTKGWNEKQGIFSQAYGEDACDAANLLMEHYGFIPASDPKYKSTVLKTYDALCRNGLMLRYNNEDDFGMPSSSFTVCTFWMIKSLYRIGEKEKAQTMFDEVLSYCNHVGLMSEDIDIKTKRLLGNFPQGYSHLALIDTALTLLGIDTKDVDLPLRIEKTE